MLDFRKEMMASLKSMGVKVCGTSEEFYGDDTGSGIWVSLEEGSLRSHELGEDDQYTEFLRSKNWFLEPYDMGTGMIFPITEMLT